MHITTLPVYSRLADPAEIATEPALAARLPQGWQLSQHQLETYRALLDPAIDVVINTAMTGDGKSLAGLLPLLTAPRSAPTLALFPTNELLQDQHRAAGDTLAQWGQPSDRAATLFGTRLDELYANAEQLSRPETLLNVLANHPLVLSNPDILHAILQFHYQQYGRAVTHVVGQLPQLFEQLTFDEFHLFETPQVVAVLTGLLFLKTQHPRLKTLFLSATPSHETLELLRRAGFGDRMRLIAPQQEGWYQHGAHPGAGWRQILQGCQLSFAPQSAEEWIAGGGDQTILAWFRTQRPGAKAALIVNSVATALRLVDQLRPVFEAEGLRVEPNTGLTGSTARKASYLADLLVGTSTVDVGVDFRINLIVFESLGAGAFLQRLGRLGRHTSYNDRQGHEQAFTSFAAYALVPAFIFERLTQPDNGQPAALHAGATYTRDELAQFIARAFPTPTTFTQYTRLWGRFVPARVFQTLSRKELRASFGAVREQLKQRYYDLTHASMVKTCKEWEERDKQGEGLLITEAHSFRGGSPFDCGLLKPDEGEAISYDLFWLLANGQLELLDQASFRAALRRMNRPDAAFARGFQRFFFRWRGMRSQREPVTILLGPQVAAWGPERHQTAQVLPGIQVDCAGHDCLTQLNRELLDAPCVGLLVPGFEPRQLQRTCALPLSLQLLPYRANGDAGEQTGTIAFGRDALLLDSRLRQRPVGASPSAPLIF